MPGSLTTAPAPCPQRPLRILAIDQGATHFGLCLAEYDGRIVRPLFLGTASIEPKPLNEMVEPRAVARRMRRTAREHRRRLKRLRDLLGGRGGPLHAQPDRVQIVAAFCKRRGHFYGEDDEGEETPEIGAAISHQEFQAALEPFLATLLLDAACRSAVQRICTSVLSPKGRRPMRVDARKVGVCQWAGCTCRRATAGVGSVLQGLAGKLRPFLEAGVLTREVLHTVAQTAVEAPDTGPTALIRQLETDLLTGFGLGERRDERGKPLAAEKALLAWLDDLAQPVAGERPSERATRLERVKLLARWHRPKRKESIRPGVLRDLVSARTIHSNGAAGRSRFCPAHQQAYITAFMHGERPPLAEQSQEVSRRLEILADKLTTYLRRRVLGTPARSVDHLVIESSAFDTLRMLRARPDPRDRDGGGKRKPPPRMSSAEEARLYELYWEGPRADFPDTKTMLLAEFGGLCAYCGQALGTTCEEDHVLPRQRFPMEGYLVRVPTCTACNRAKGQRSLVSFDGGIHPEALAAFTAYVAKRKAAKAGAIHPILEIKKGFLQNLTREALRERLAGYGGDQERAERSLREMAGSWMLQTTATARHGRYLRQALARHVDIPLDQARAVSPRHAALLRDALTEAWDYDKAALKASGDRVDNHALDAYVLALGSATGCFARMAMLERFSRTTEDILTETVASGDPAFRTHQRFDLDLLPVPGAEEQTVGFGVMGGQRARGDADGGTGVRLVSLSPPSRQHSRYDTTLYALAGPTRDAPARRLPVADFWARLQKAKDKGSEVIARLTHPTLRVRLQDAWTVGGVLAAEQALVRWYRETASGFDKPGPHVRHASHPTIQGRWDRIRAFLANPAATVQDLPSEFALRLLQEGRSKETTPLVRGPHQHQRLASGGVVAKVVGYRGQPDGSSNRARPIVLSVQPDWSIFCEGQGRFRDLPPLPPALSAPLRHEGTPFPPRRRQKQAALAEWFRAAQARETHWITAGSTIRRADGTREFVPNHKDAPPSRYRGIVGIERGLPRA